MKYSQLISFNPIEDVIQLTSANDSQKAREYVKTYVMSDTMANNLKTLVIDQLNLDEVIDNKGVLIVGNYGTGKSHLMSVISAVANDADNLQYLQNKKFAKDMECIAGKFEVLRFEFTGIDMSLREFVLETIMEDFAERGIDYTLPDLSKVKDNKKLMLNVMSAFNAKYPGRGYLLVVDELLNYLASRNTHQIVMDLEFLRVLGEMCSKSKLRVIFGMQEKLFNNPKFSFVADTLGHVRDRITEMVIAKEDTSYVVSERILKKTPEQKALIRAHLEKFSELYSGMANKMDEFVDMFPIHPSYMDILNKVHLIENRHVLKNISVTIKEIFDKELPDDKPGIISFDDYWPKIKSTPMLRTNPEIRRVLEASEKLEDIIQHAFPKAAYKPLAIQIIYALSVHRLTTNGLDVQFGLTAENLKDDLCLYLDMPERSSEFLLGVVQATLKDIMSTVSGQFIIHNESNNQYYIDVDKTVDYDEKVKQRATMMPDDELNRAFYKVVYECLEWDERQYVTNFEIYQRDLNWVTHNVYREGYLFMGLPGERSTAQPERDFYIHFMPPYGIVDCELANLPDEVYFFFRSSAEFKDLLGLYAAAIYLSQISEGKDKNTYNQKAVFVRSKLIKYLNDNKFTCFDVSYKGNKYQLIEVLKNKYRLDTDFKDTIDITASICLDDYFCNKYPDFPILKTKVTRKNQAEVVRYAYDSFAGRKNQTGTLMLQSFNLLDGDKIRPENSKYAAYYIEKIKSLPPQGVINYADIFDAKFGEDYEDKRFKIGYVFTPIIFLSLVYGGYAAMTLNNGTVITASTLDKIPTTTADNLYEFKYLSKPSGLPMVELKRLFDVIDLNSALLDNPDVRERENCVSKLLEKAQELCNRAVVANNKLISGFELWGEPMVADYIKGTMQSACNAIRDEFGNYSAKYNTPARLNNFRLNIDQINALDEKIKLLFTIEEYDIFRSETSSIVSYVSNIEYIDFDEQFKNEIAQAKANFRTVRDSILQGEKGDNAARKVNSKLEQVKAKYIDLYFEEHKKKRLDINGSSRKAQLQQSISLANLRKLRGIEILSGAKLTAIEQDLANLKVCYELTVTELKTNHVCPHCRYNMGERTPVTTGKLDHIESQIDDLITEWTQTLVNTLDDPLLDEQKEYLPQEYRIAIDDFISTKTLPQIVDVTFINAVKQLLQGFEPVVIESSELAEKLEQLPPLNEQDFKKQLNALIAQYTRGKDPDKLRIIVKHKDEE